MNVNMISMTAVLWVYSHDMSIFWNIVQCVYAKYTTNYTYSNIVQAFVCVHTYVKLVGMITPFTHWRWHVCGCLFVTFSLFAYGYVWQHTVACGVVLLDSAAVKSRHRHPSSQRCERAPHTHATHHPNYAEWAISIECNAFESMYSLR